MILDIAVGASAKSKTWKNKKTSWADLSKRLSETTRTRETAKEYAAMSKDDQVACKDIGGFVGGYLIGGRRKPESVGHRCVIALDADYAQSYEQLLYSAEAMLGCAYAVHTSHSHTKEKPRVRVVIPLSRPVSSDEYVAIARAAAGWMGIEIFDPTTFQPYRLMYWPSSPKDGEFRSHVEEGEAMDADYMLATYADWRDSSLWPCAKGEAEAIRTEAGRQADPRSKGGVVGAFCRTYGITEAIAEFLPEKYTPCDNGRYTYAAGSAAGGLVIYADDFAFSHHGTDPAGGKLCNAWDLVRLHKFGHLDGGKDKGEKAESQTAMEAYAITLDEVKRTMSAERRADSEARMRQALDADSADEGEEYAGCTEPAEHYPGYDPDWELGLESDKKGEVKPTSANIALIMAKDPMLAGKFRRNEFDGMAYAHGRLPWDTDKAVRPVRDSDNAGLRAYIETAYGIYSPRKVDDALALAIDRHAYNPVKDYLTNLKWDGINRVDTVLHDYLGVEATPYSVEASRKLFCGGVARALNPGCKFDLMLVMTGAQGAGKSKFARYIGKDWASDSFDLLPGKASFESLQGAWVIEMAELSAFRAAKVEQIKHFLTKQADSYREAYGRYNVNHKRGCIFLGTANKVEVLQDSTGARRFMPVEVDTRRAKYQIDELPASVDQIWAEAVHMYKAGEKLYFDEAIEAQANTAREHHTELDPRTGLIREYLETKIHAKPEWDAMDIIGRRIYFESGAGGETERASVCVAEIWCECLGRDKADMDTYKTREINAMLRAIGWVQQKTTKTFKNYGVQKFYTRPE